LFPPFLTPNIQTPPTDIVETVYRGARKGRGLVVSPRQAPPHIRGGVCGSQRGFVLCFPVKGCVCETPRRNKFQCSSFVRNCTKLFMNPENSFSGRPKCFGPFRRNNCGFIHEVFSIFLEIFMVISPFDKSQWFFVHMAFFHNIFAFILAIAICTAMHYLFIDF